jgi:integrase
MGHIRKIGDNKWRIVAEVETQGRRQRLVRHFSGTETQAKKELRRLEIDAAQEGQKFDASARLVGDFLLYWVDHIARPDLAPNTYDSYRWEIEKHIVPLMGHIPLSGLTPLLVQEFYAHKLQAGSIAPTKKGGPPRGLSNRSVAYLHSILSQALECAVDLELLEKNPCAKAKPPRGKRTQSGPQMYVLNIDQLRDFLAFAQHHRDYAVIYTAAYTGARQSELLGLVWSSVLWDQCQLSISQALRLQEGGPAKFNLDERTKNPTSRRRISVTDADLAVLRAHRTQLQDRGWDMGPDALVFPDADGGFMNRKNLSKRFATLG